MSRGTIVLGGQLSGGTNVWGDKCPGGTDVLGGHLSRGTVVQGDNCPGGQMSGGQMSGGQMSGGQMSEGQMSQHRIKYLVLVLQDPTGYRILSKVCGCVG